MWNNGTQERVVLIVDVWQPSMSPADRRAIMAEEPALLARYNSLLKATGQPQRVQTIKSHGLQL